ncbi:MAG: hypothetical protein ACREJO_05175 [Phycisphaerales bacterium]
MFRIDALDVGSTKYGDCLVCQIGAHKILIDGSHPGDQNAHPPTESIPAQMARVLGTQAPFTFDLLVVTHTHSDHIGCLPTLVGTGIVNATTALVADEKLGYGDIAIDEMASDTPQARAIELLRCDVDHAAMSDRELERLLAEVDGQFQTYSSMLGKLKAAGTKVIRYVSPASAKPVEKAFADIGFKVLGPTTRHLRICAEAIKQAGRKATDAFANIPSDRLEEVIALVRRVALTQLDALPSADSPGMGAAINNQSMVIAIRHAGVNCLLLGDMQLAAPEVSGLESQMAALNKKIAQNGPYDLVKTPHHTSYNGLSEAVLKSFGPSPALVHSGGSDDPGHPSKSALAVLKANTQKVRWARTDRNGLITCTVSNGKVALKLSRGQLNDSRVNPPHPDVEPAAAVERSIERAETPARELSPGAVTTSGDPRFVEIVARVPQRGARVRLDIVVEPASDGEEPPVEQTSEDPSRPKPLPAVRLAGGRTLPRLLFVTSSKGLVRNVGQAATDRAMEMIRSAGQTLVDLGANGDIKSAVTSVRSRISENEFAGVVLVGGPDIVPSERLDVLSSDLRQSIGSEVSQDADSFIVWSDDVYGDQQGDGDPEVPVSRVPDGRSAETLIGALSANAPVATLDRAGVRNLHRPFAKDVFSSLPGKRDLLSSHPSTSTSIVDGELRGTRVYFMLHGSDTDATKFWGEGEAGGYPVAVELASLPVTPGAVAFAGCCWGAMLADATASTRVTRIGGRTARDSIAVRFVGLGGVAFVGCTGSHYSPTVKPYKYFGGPLHEAFWSRLAAGDAPAAALLKAKHAFLAGMPHNQTGNDLLLGIEAKILRIFTCVGLGW